MPSAGKSGFLRETSTIRVPIQVAITEQSDGEAAIEALRAELAGGPPTGFDPIEYEDDLTVAFTTCIIHVAIDDRRI